MIRFNQIDEFINEIRKEVRQEPGHVGVCNVENGIVRVTGVTESWKVNMRCYAGRRESLVATAKVRGEIVRLDRHFGTLWGEPGEEVGPSDEKVLEKAREIMKVLVEELEGMGLDVRSGVYE